MTAVIGYVATLRAMVAADMIWLGVMVDRLYRPTLGDVLAGSVNLPAAILFYAIFPIGS